MLATALSEGTSSDAGRGTAFGVSSHIFVANDHTSGAEPGVKWLLNPLKRKEEHRG